MASTTKDIRIDDLRAELSGELITLDDPGYDDARTVFFRGVDRHPLAVARVADAEDVAGVVSFAREGGLELAVRSGGHSYAGHDPDPEHCKPGRGSLKVLEQRRLSNSGLAPEHERPAATPRVRQREAPRAGRAHAHAQRP
jgi:hypothetical protein